MQKICTFVALFYGGLAFGQIDTAWVRYYNGQSNGFDFAEAVAVDENGNVFVTGYSRRNEGDFDFATIKYNGNGDLVWVSRYNGTANGYDYAHALAIDGEGNVYVTGNSEGSGTGYDFAKVFSERQKSVRKMVLLR